MLVFFLMPEVKATILIDKDLEQHINSKLEKTGERTNQIPFRQWEGKVTKEIFKLPIEYCRFRVNNGRIRSKVKSYEKTKGLLSPENEETQKIIFEFLGQQDPTENNALKSLLKKSGQKEPAIITADGFLINGNRRLWALKTLSKEGEGQKFKYINVVILPGSGQPDAPTYEDIALLELRLQNQKTGKSDYTGIDKALQTRDYVRDGNITLKEILKDDPVYADLNEKKFEVALKNFERDNFETLDLVDKYLKSRNQEGDYDSISDRWLSFQELTQKVISKFSEEKFLNKYKIEEIDKGLIQAAAFNFIQLKNTADIVPKNINLIRGITDWLDVDKKAFLKIGKIETNNSDDEWAVRDNEWQENQGQEIKNQLKMLQNLVRKKDEATGPIKRLEEALWCLEHDDLDIQKYDKISTSILEKSFELTQQIENLNNGLKSYFYNKMKDVGKKTDILVNKHKK